MPPSPLIAADRRTGFAWACSVRQLEIADTAVFDRPAARRAFFEAAIRDHLDLGRPDKVRIIFDRWLVLRGKNQTSGSFATQVITLGTRARIEIRYKTSGAKAYVKEGRALRVETTINNPKCFDLKKTLNAENWRALCHLGEAVSAGRSASGEAKAPRPQSSSVRATGDARQPGGNRSGPSPLASAPAQPEACRASRRTGLAGRRPSRRPRPSRQPAHAWWEGGRVHPKRNLCEEEATAVPPGVMTDTLTAPAASAGVVTLQLVTDEQRPSSSPFAPNFTVVAPATQPVPLMVTTVPPEAGLRSG